MKRIAEAGYRVSVSGTGADELFSGYYDHHLAYLFEMRGDATLHAAAKAAWAREVRPYVRNPHLSNPDLFIQAPAFRDHIFLNSRVFSDFLTRPWF